jgi:Zn-dependent protease
MLGRRLTLFDAFGFPIRIDLSWFLVAGLVTWSLATGAFPSREPGLESDVYWMMGVAGALGLFGSIVLHELAHALMARRFDLEIEGITLFLFGGVAEMREEPPGPRAEFWVAVAGPAASLAIGLVALGTSVTLGAAALGAPVVCPKA